MKHKNINQHKNRGAFDLQNIKRVGHAVFFYFVNFYSLILEDNIVFYLSFVIIYGNLLKYIADTTQIFLWKLCIVPSLNIYNASRTWKWPVFGTMLQTLTKVYIDDWVIFQGPTSTGLIWANKFVTLVGVGYPWSIRWEADTLITKPWRHDI